MHTITHLHNDGNNYSAGLPGSSVKHLQLMEQYLKRLDVNHSTTLSTKPPLLLSI